MARRNPEPGPFKVHIRKAPGGYWHRFFRGPSGRLYFVVDMSWMTANGVNAKKANLWCINENARIVASLGARRG